MNPLNYQPSLKAIVKILMSHADSPEREKIVGVLYIIFTIAAVSIFGFFAINPTISTLSSLNKQLDDTKALNDALKRKIDAISELRSEYENNKQLVDTVSNTIPFSPEIPRLARKLEKLAQADSVQLSQLNFGSIELYPAGKKDASLYSFTLSIDIKGSERQKVTTFINDMIIIDRLVTIDSITIEKKQIDTQDTSITARAYFNK